MSTKPKELQAEAARRLDLSPEVNSALNDIQAELLSAYRESFMEMISALNQQASALERIQTTLGIIVGAVAPTLKESVPPAIRAAKDGEHPDLASAVLTPDPIATGYTLSLNAFARATGCSAVDASILVRAFRLCDDPECAVVVRQGTSKSSRYVNYHPRAVDKFLRLLKASHPKLKPDQRTALKRARKAVSTQST